MKSKAMATIVMILALGGMNAAPASAQHEGHATKNGPSSSGAEAKKAMSHDQMMMANEPHHVLAMAYHQSLMAFAKALQNQTQGAGSVNVEFARAAVSEMRRSHNEMKQQHQGHMQTMSAEKTARMGGMMQLRETHEAELNTRLTALEQEVQSATPDAKKVSTLAASVHSHLDAMSKMKQGSKGNKMTTMR